MPNEEFYIARRQLAENAKRAKPPSLSAEQLNTPIPSTGESYQDWLGRRIALGLEAGMHALWSVGFAQTPMSDFELDGAIKVAATVPVPAPRTTGPTPQGVTTGGGSPQPLQPGESYPSLAGQLRTSPIGAVARGVAKATDFALPEDIEDFAGNVKSFLLGGSTTRLDPRFGIEDGGPEFEGVLPAAAKIAKPLHVAGGIVAQGVGGTGRLLGGTIGEVAHSFGLAEDRPGLKEAYASLPDPKKAWKAAVSTPAGDVLMNEVPLFGRGSLPYRAAAGATNFWLDNVAFSTLGGAARGAQAAERIPKGAIIGATELQSLRSREIGNRVAQYVFDRNAMTPAQLVKTPRGRTLVKEIERVRGQAGIDATGALLGRFPSLPTGMAKELARTDDVAGTLEAGLKGDLFPTRRVEMVERIREIDAEIPNVKIEEPDFFGEAPAYTDGLAFPTTDAKIAALQDERKALQAVLDGTDLKNARVVLPQLPDDTFSARFRDFARSMPKDSTSRRLAGALNDNQWWRNVTRVLPKGGIDKYDRTLGAQQVRAWGDVLGYKTTEIDGFVARYVEATPGEVYDLANQMLKDAPKMPDSMRRPLTQTVTERAGDYALEPNGLPTEWHYTDSIGVAHQQPMMTSQLADEVPMPNPMDIVDARRLSKRYQRFVNDSTDDWNKLTKGAVRSVARGPVDAWVAAQRAEQWFIRNVWKPSVLARLGWTGKVVVLDEHIRAAALDVPSLWNHPFEFVTDRVAVGKLRKAEVLRTEGLRIGGPEGRKLIAQADEQVAKWSNPYRGALLSTPEEVLSDLGADLAGFGRRTFTGKVSRGNKGFGEAWQAELASMSAAPEMRYLARHGKADTLKWLQETPAGRRVAEDMAPILAKTNDGTTLEQWVDVLDSRLNFLAPTDELKDAVRYGRVKLGDISRPLGDHSVATDLGTMAIDHPTKTPAVVRDTRRWFGARPGFGTSAGEGWRRFTNGAMDLLGSRPSNMTRSQVYGYVKTREVDSLVARGIPKELAEEVAHAKGVAVTNELLYDLGERTAYDQLHVALIPFFPAWREVLKTYSKTLPNHLGAELGHVVLYGKVNALAEFGKDLGVLETLELPDGEKSPGLVIGPWKFPLESLLMFGSVPSLGPLRQQMVNKAAQDYPKILEFERKMGWLGLPETSLGPSTLNRLWWAALQTPPPWERWMGSARFQKAQWDMTFGNHIQAKASEINEIAQLEVSGKLTPVQARTKLQEIIDQARTATRLDYVVGATRGFILPISPLNQGDPALKQIQKSMDAMSPEAKAEVMSDLARHNPDVWLQLKGQTVLTDATLKDEKGRDAFWRQVLTDKRKILSGEEAARMWLGYAEHNYIRTRYSNRILTIGKNGREIIQNYHRVIAAAEERNTALRHLKYVSDHDPQSATYGWDDIYQGVIDTYHPRDEKENLALEAIENLGALPSLFADDVRETLDFGNFGAIKAELSNIIDAARDEKGNLPKGPEGTMLKWFDKVYSPYLDTVDKFYDEAKGKQTSPSRSEVFDRLRQYNDNLKEVKIDGVAMPTPDLFSYYKQDAKGRAAMKIKWAMQDPSWWTANQRILLNVDDGNQKAREFWDTYASMSVAVDQAAAGLSSSERGRVNDALQAWGTLKAKQAGVGAAFAKTQEPRYKRLNEFGLVPKTPEWERMTQVADMLHAIAESQDRKRPNQDAQRAFFAWIQATIKEKPEFGSLLAELQSSSYDSLAKAPLERFISFLMWEG